MGITVVTTRVAATVDTAPYTQDITTPDLGELFPKGALIIVTKATVDGTAVDDAVFSWGAATGAANEWVTSFTSDHNLATSNSYNVWDSSKCIKLLNPTDGTIDGEAEFSAWITNGIRINWTNAPAAAYLITVVLVAGTDLLVHANNSGDLDNILNHETDITAPGFTPDIIITGMTKGTGGQEGSSRGSGWFGHGFVHFDGDSTITQRGLGICWRDGRNTTTNNMFMRDDAGCVWANLGNNVDFWLEFSDFDANGFSVTTRNDGGNNQVMNYLALSFGGAVDSWVGTHTTPTGVNGDTSDAGPSFIPQAVLLIPNLGEAWNTGYVDNRSGSHAFSVFDADDEYANSTSDEDNVGTTNSQSLSDDRAVALPDDDGALDIEATFVSFDANGWTLNYSNAPAAAKLWPALAIEEEAGGVSYTLTAVQGSLTLTGQAITLPVARQLTSAQGSLTLTGQTALLPLNRMLTASQGSYVLSGQAVGLDFSGGATLVAAQGSYALSGQAMTPTIAVYLAMAQGAYVLSGQTALLPLSRLLTAAQGAYVLSGQDMLLTIAMILTAAQGSYVLSGQDITLFTGILFGDPDNTTFIFFRDGRSFALFRDRRSYVEFNDRRTKA
jgi:hypothetical protein